jgi:hypothetical protein
MKQAILVSAILLIASTTTLHAADPGDSTLKAIPDTKQLFQEILDVTGLKPRFKLKEADVLNIEATISKKERLILYNPTFINWINNSTRSKWATLALLAHEMGHHLNGHTMQKGGSAPHLELEADEFAGFVLYKLGATLEQAQLVMYYIAKKNVSSPTHPSREDRMEAISRGWHREADNIARQ